MNRQLYVLEGEYFTSVIVWVNVRLQRQQNDQRDGWESNVVTDTAALK